MLQGDLNEVQQFALLFYLAETDRRAAEKEWDRFKWQAMMMRPDIAKKLAEIEDNDPTEFAPTMTDEQMEQMQPLSGEEISAALDIFSDFGLAMAPPDDDGIREV